MSTTLTAILLGILEGLTEFLPVSSTGHLILAQGFFGYDPAQWRQFNIVIQLGAILAVVVSYWSLFWSMGTGLLRGEAQSVRFVRNILLGFLPAAVIGLLAKDAIDVMLESPLVVAGALIVGGIAILVLEKIIPARPDHGVAALSWKSCLTIGLVQCLAMVPGTSRSAATIMGALAMGVGRKTAAEFSFFLAVPTMLGAATVKILDEPALLAGEAAIGWSEIALGFLAAFLVALAVIRAFVAYVSKHGFSPFAWYRIALGLVAVWFFGIA
ncbi:undecaprenyl-diphosphatase [Erythrobacter sp. HI0063]|jgi:undecaprenyl-diphosphatase|uniref:undecaprenyl-diphosphate phosphatase n=1 Tax=unclassified Erythrobacter TaxID=2633097 RepID=UPI0007C34CDC|nr:MULTISPECIES: undecaprenyl-diphosphate phosphatase [unclassified Erythrobacter]KZY55504.1 undecaprenyl-diphosphatase [Erythrobacter sp. HI0063]MBO9511765.1 undecaprenyl-diphosphate phosphatase [Erythrobacter sp. A6_0]